MGREHGPVRIVVLSRKEREVVSDPRWRDRFGRLNQLLGELGPEANTVVDDSLAMVDLRLETEGLNALELNAERRARGQELLKLRRERATGIVRAATTLNPNVTMARGLELFDDDKDSVGDYEVASLVERAFLEAADRGTPMINSNVIKAWANILRMGYDMQSSIDPSRITTVMRSAIVRR
jgi:hypothetical protein